MSECQSLKVLLACRPDEWNADERQRVQAHLATCAQCTDLARAYTEQDRLLCAGPRARLTSVQRAQLFAKTQKERKKYTMFNRLSTALGTMAAVAALALLAWGLGALLRSSSSPDPLATQKMGDLSTAMPAGPHSLDAEQVLWQWLDTAEDEELAHETTIILQRLPWWDGELILFTYQDHFPESAGGERLKLLAWILAEPRPSGEGWAVTAFGSTEQAIQNNSDWGDGLYQIWQSERQVDQARTISVVYGLWPKLPELPIPNPLQLIWNGTPVDIPLRNDSFLYVTEEIWRERPKATWNCKSDDALCAALIRTDDFPVSPKPPIFANQIRYDNLHIYMDRFAPRKLYAPGIVTLDLQWQVLAPPSVDWAVFVHLTDEAGRLVAQSDAPVDWPEQPCSENTQTGECVVRSQHHLSLPADLASGLYTISVGLYDPVTGARAPVTSLPETTSPVAVDQIQIVPEPTQDNQSQSIEAALVQAILPVGTDKARCGWQVLGEAQNEMYLWVYCSGEPSAASLPAVVYLTDDGRVRDVQIPRDGSLSGQDIRALFPADVQTRILEHDIDMQAILRQMSTQVTLNVYSGRPNPTWFLDKVIAGLLQDHLESLPPTEQPLDEVGRLGYTGFELLLPDHFELLLPDHKAQPERRVKVWNGVVRVTTGDQVELFADEGRALERLLLETAVGQVEQEVIELVRQELPLLDDGLENPKLLYGGPGMCDLPSASVESAGSFVWPTASRVFHSTPDAQPGIDITGSQGDAIYAADNGVVVYAGWNDVGYGSLLVLDHGQLQTVYAHLSEINVACGQSVPQGMAVGALGSTGNVTTTALRFEVLEDGYRVNPLVYLPSSPVEPGDRFAIYLVAQEIDPQNLPLMNPSELELESSPILTLDDIITYTWQTHEMTFTDEAYQRLARLKVPVVPGLPFVVYVGQEAIYAGALWISFSSASFHGIVIDVLPAMDKRPLRLQLGYPESPELFVGQDLRSDPRIRQALEKAGKLSDQ